MEPVATKRELQVALEEEVLVTQGGSAAEDSIVGASAKGEIVSVDPAHRRAGHLDFVSW